ncbi:hypothetical protein [Pseudonocardia spinosispora]|uniref:hypothetical protein n=1 Tax=Pseudonocardia spinosispora TaxID=103441 RepID=UPI0004052C5C|nr:hypothetical protein [Pseudonocardia spinosispora]
MTIHHPRKLLNPVSTDELHDLAAVSAGLREVHRNRDRNRLIALVLLVMTAAGLWVSRAQWLPLVTSTDPFQTTPAANFPTAPDGLVLPEATAVEGMTAAQVDGALRQVKSALEASYLDDRLLVGHDPATLLSLLAPDSAGTVRSMLADGDYGTTMIRLAPGTVLAGPPRVNGRLSYARVDWNGLPALDVTSNYVWAYAFDQPSGVVVLHSETHWMFPLAKNLRPTSRGMYLGASTGYWHGMDCTASTRGLTAPAPPHARNTAPDFRDPDPTDAYFDPHRSVQVDSACR